jgi:tartrate-resistant acid phosphatase type 5
MRRLLPLFLIPIALICIHCSKEPDVTRSPAPASEQRVGLPVRKSASRPTESNAINLLLFADWGKDNDRQRAVARAMADYASTLPYRIDAALIAGDNFYVPLESPDDPAFGTVFEYMYDIEQLDFPFYVVAGNHEYAGNRFAHEMEYSRRNPASRFRFPARWYALDFGGSDGRPGVKVLMLDSNDDRISDEDWNEQTRFVSQTLDAAGGAWTMAVAHHPLFSNGLYQSHEILLKDWGPAFKSHHLDFYVNGHEHDLEHLEVDGWGMSLLLVGGGGAPPREMWADKHGPFSRAINGFAHLRIERNSATVTYIDVNRNIVHSLLRTRQGVVRSFPTSRDTPTTRSYDDLLHGRTAAPAND